MGKKKKSKAKAPKKPRKDEDSDIMHDEVDDFMEQRQMIPLERDNSSKKLDEDDILDNEVMALSDEEDDDDMEEDDDMDEDGFGAPKDDLSSDFEQGDGQEEDDEDIGEKWGKRKRTYYSTDYVDSEIVSSDNEAKAEEEEVMLMQKKKRKEQNDDEFLDTFGAILSGKGKKKEKGSKNADFDELEDNVERISKDVAGLSTREKLEVLMNDSPELLKLLETFRSKIVELNETIAPLLKKVREAELPTSPGVSYLEAKFHLLLSYCINICFYLLRKAEGKSVKDHPVIHQLVRIRTILEKLRPLDTKLKYQIEKLLKMSTLGSSDPTAGAAAIDERLAHRANLSAFAPKNDEAEGAESGEPKKYVIPKRDAVKMEDEREKLAAKRLKDMQRAKRSKVAQALLEEFGDKPEQDSSSRVTRGGGKQDELDREEEELRRYEEENFVRLDQKRIDLEKKRKKKAKKQPEFYEDLTDIGDFSVLSTLNKDDEEVQDPKTSAKAPKRSFQDMLSAVTKDQPEDGDELLPRKKKAKVAQPESNFDDDAMDLSDNAGSSKKSKSKNNNPKFEEEKEGLEGDDDLIDDDAYYKEVEAQQRAEKKGKKTQGEDGEGGSGSEGEGGAEGEEGGKRGITYAMQKNKGLSKRSKNAIRNPRVKRKVQYEKAVKKRNSQVQKHRDQNNRYSGEATGIKTNVVKSRQF